MCWHWNIEALKFLCLHRADASGSAAFTVGVLGLALVAGAAFAFAFYRGRLKASGSVDALAFASRMQLAVAVVAAGAFAFAGAGWTAGIALVAAIPPALNQFAVVPAMRETPGAWPGLGRGLEWATAGVASAAILFLA